MEQQKEFILFLVFILLFPLMVRYSGKNGPTLLFIIIVCLLIGYYWKDQTTTDEQYDRMDYFPWNEARLVRKRIHDSTTIDCGWFLDQKTQNNNIFRMDDPVVANYSNQSDGTNE